MAKYVKNSSQGLLLLSLVVLACSGTRISGRSIDAMSSNLKTTEARNIVVDGDVNGCFHNPFPHSESENFCCNKDNQCWPSLQACIPNCPCMVNCGGKEEDSEAKMRSTIHG